MDDGLRAPVLAGLASGVALILAFILLLPLNPSSSNDLPELSPPPLWIIIERQPDNAVIPGAAGQYWLIITDEKEIESFPSLRKATEIADSEEGSNNHMFTSYPTYVVKADDIEEGNEIVREIQDRSGLVYQIENSTSDSKVIHLIYEHRYRVMLVQSPEEPMP